MVQKGSAESLCLRSLLLACPYDTFDEVIRKENIPYARSTIEKIAKHHSSPEIPRLIVRKNMCLKPYLDNATVDSRLKFCEWALLEIAHGAIFIFSDETYVNFGGVSFLLPCNPRACTSNILTFFPGFPKKRRITVQRGDTAKSIAQPTRKSAFQLMFWGTMCSEITVQRPSWAWVSETHLERAGYGIKLAKIMHTGQEYTSAMWNKLLYLAQKNTHI